MSHPFDPGYVTEPFLTLCADYPGADVYPSGQFRSEWGPIFHRGRLDGSARVLVIGQDPAQHETVVRRILVGEAGRRVQGLLAKLGVSRSYVLINTYLYSVYGSVKAKTRKDPRPHRLPQPLAGCIAGWQARSKPFSRSGTAADEAWRFWKATPAGQACKSPIAAVTHPTQPESSSKGDKTKLAAATKKMLQNWNGPCRRLSPAIAASRRAARPLVLYGDGLGRRRPACRFRSATFPPACRHGCTSRTAGRDARARTISPSGATSPSRSPKGVVA